MFPQKQICTLVLKLRCSGCFTLFARKEGLARK